jgi:hypothetical protein
MMAHSPKWGLVYMLAQTYALDMLEAVSKKAVAVHRP